MRSQWCSYSYNVLMVLPFRWLMVHSLCGEKKVNFHLQVLGVLVSTVELIYNEPGNDEIGYITK